MYSNGKNDKLGMEACVDSLKSALNAVSGGANRLQLCTGLSIGGLTPSIGLVKQVITKIPNVPVSVLIRPREGDFLYSTEEIEIMLTDISAFKDAGASGVVIGALQRDGNIDRVTCEKLISAARPLSVTFHYAYDLTSSPLTSLEDVIELGCARLLTSGQAKTAFEGAGLIKALIEQANGRITILPSSGITIDNLGYILCTTGAREFQGEASMVIESKMDVKEGGNGGNNNLFISDVKQQVCDVMKVRKMIEIAYKVWQSDQVLG